MSNHEKPETDETKPDEKPEEKPAPNCPNCGEVLGSEKCLANCGVQAS